MERPSFAALLAEAVTEPGTISEAYSAFHSYSFGNVIAAWSQCRARQIKLGPIATYKAWQSKGRQVKRGEKAIVLCMPMTVKDKPTDAKPEADGCHTFFAWRPFWFVLGQTDGSMEPEAVSLPDWNEAQALATLKIERADFDMADGNVMGYARARTITVSPLAYNPVRTLLHEIAHVVLGHTEKGEHTETETLTRSAIEVEAEATAYLVGSALGVQGLEMSRGYLQHWLAGNKVDDKSAARIFKAADAILKAGARLATEGGQS